MGQTLIKADIIVDTRSVSKKNNNQYPVKIRIYDGKNPHRYIALKKYQSSKELKKDLIIRQREVRLDEELEYINKNSLNLDDAINIIKNGIPALTSNQERILLLEQELKFLKSKEIVVNFEEYIDKFIKKKGIKNQRVKSFIDTKNSFINYNGGNFNLNEIDFSFIEGFYDLNKMKGNKYSNFYLKYNNLKQVYFDAKRNLNFYNSNNPFEFNSFVNYDKKEDFSLSISDIQNIYLNRNIIFKSGKKNNLKIRRIVYLYLFLFAIGGHNFVELSHLKWCNIVDGRLEFYRQKLESQGGGEFISNKLFPFAYIVLEEFGTKDSDYIFDFIPDINIYPNGYKKEIVNARNYLKYVKVFLEINKNIKTNSTRHTFNTIARNNLVNTYFLEKIQGHKSKGMTFNYTGKIDYSVQDAEHKKVLDLVFTDC